MNIKDECLQRLKATTQLLSNVCERYNISATVIDKDGNEAPIVDIISDNMAFIRNIGCVNADSPPKEQ